MNFRLKDIVPQLITVIAVVLIFGFFTYNAQAHDTGKVTVSYTDNTERLLHQLTINITDELFRHLPAILDSISATMRQEVDKEYKCSIQPDDYKNKECYD